MITGTVGKLSDKTVDSANTIQATASIIRLAGSTPIKTIVPAHGYQFAQGVILYSVSGSISILETGNIDLGGVATNATPLKGVQLYYNTKLQKWTL